MLDMHRTLGETLSDPRISQIAKDAIRDMDLTREPMWGRTLEELRAEHFGGNLALGLERLFRAAGSGKWYYELSRHGDENTSLTWFPSRDPAADARPYILLVPGGGFVNVWNLTEGWPVAAQYNELGYHVFILTYQVRGGDILRRNMEDFASAISFIRDHAGEFHVSGDYMTCGFSAGGYLVCLWNTEKGYAAFDLPSPKAVFPVYPVTSWKISRERGFAPDSAVRLFGCTIDEACDSAFEIPEHAEGFPPCALFLAAQDDLVPPDHSKTLAASLEKLGIPCRLEIGPEGGHGFADGTGMCMEGWPKRAVRWAEELQARASS
ncbi:MAG: alpha/beta hydrolase [Clostridia bacterium]|nr:alpha/beta hydrolase [Clostridia bacterium]